MAHHSSRKGSPKRRGTLSDSQYFMLSYKVVSLRPSYLPRRVALRDKLRAACRNLRHSVIYHISSALVERIERKGERSVTCLLLDSN